MARRAPLELAFVPRGVEEPLLGFYSLTPLTPGGWADLLGDVGLPDTLRRLSQAVVLGDSRRTVEMRCLEMLPAVAYLLTERDGPSSASVRAWRLAARVVERVDPRRRRRPRPGRFAAAFPAAGHAVLVRDEEGEVATETAADAVAGVRRRLDRARCPAAVRDPRSCGRPRRTPTSSTSGCCSRSSAPSRPTSAWLAPLVRLRDTLEPLRLRLEAPTDADAGWPLHADPPDPALLSGRRRLPPAGARDRRAGDARAGRGRRAAPGRRGARVRRRGGRAAVRAGRGAGPGRTTEPTSTSPRARCRSTGSSATTCARRSAGARSAPRSSGRSRLRRSRSCGSAASGGRSRAAALARAQALAAIALHGSACRR